MRYLNGFEDNVAVGGGITGADEAGGKGNEFLEVVVGYSVDFELGVEVSESIESLMEFVNDLLWISSEEFFCLPDAAHFEVEMEEPEKVRDQRNTTGEGQVDRFQFFPRGKGPICNDQGIGVADA